MNDEFSNQVFVKEIFGKCADDNNKLVNGEIILKQNIGKYNRKYLSDALNNLINKVDIYADKMSVNKNGNYDYIITPSLNIAVNYNEEQMNNRKYTRRTYEWESVGLGHRVDYFFGQSDLKKVP